MTKTDILDSLCIYRWSYPIIDFGKNQIRTCCKTIMPGYENSSQTFDSFIDFEYMQQRRLEMFQGIRHESCSACWRSEDQNIPSMRHAVIPDGWVEQESKSNQPDKLSNESVLVNTRTQEQVKIADIDIGHNILKSTQPSMIEIILSNHCDMNCVYCSPYFSSTWLTQNAAIWAESTGWKDFEASNGYERLKQRVSAKPSESFNEEFYKWFKKVLSTSNNLRFGFIGGEPVINPKFFIMIDKIESIIKKIPIANRPHSGLSTNILGQIQDNKPALFIVSNLNFKTKQKEKFYEKLGSLSKLFSIEIVVSIEGIGSRAEYVRMGLDWNRFSQNLNELLEMKDIDVVIQPSINNLSLSGLPTFFNWVIELTKKHNRHIMLGKNMVTDPDHFHPLAMPLEYKKYLERALEMISLSNVDSKFNFDRHAGSWQDYQYFLTGLIDEFDSIPELNNEQKTKLINMLTKLDEKRHHKFSNIFPEMINTFESERIYK